MDVIVTPKALKQLGKLPRLEQAKIKRRLLILETNPLSGKKLDGELAELRSLRAWPYRIIYYINPKKIIFVTGILHRQGAYKGE